MLRTLWKLLYGGLMFAGFYGVLVTWDSPALALLATIVIGLVLPNRPGPPRSPEEVMLARFDSTDRRLYLLVLGVLLGSASAGSAQGLQSGYGAGAAAESIERIMERRLLARGLELDRPRVSLLCGRIIQADDHGRIVDVLIAPDGQFLGLLSPSRVRPESVSNRVGDYGSRVSQTSIFSRVSPYGLACSDEDRATVRHLATSR